jgi:rod shape-determining protein MreC
VILGLTVRALDSSAKQPLANLLLRTAYAPFFAVRNLSLEFAALRGENTQLRQELAMAIWRAERNQQQAREAARLRALLDQPAASPWQIHVTRVVGWERRGDRNEVIVDRGEESGIRLYAPALSQTGVAGRVSAVMADFARVQLLLDPTCRVAVRDARSGVLGVVRIGPDRVLHMDHVGVEADIMIGDSLVTAGIGGVFPEGLQVGQVIRVERVPKSLLLRVDVEPATGFDRIDYLFVLESETPAPPGAPYDLEDGES